ncbi:unnamed protein product, partial [Polarella glacialis]
VIDVEFTVRRLLRDIRGVDCKAGHHHDLLAPLEELGSLARDERFAPVCAQQGFGPLAELGKAQSCPMVRGLILEVFLILSQRSDLLNPAHLGKAVLDDLLTVLQDTLVHERP